MSKIRIVRDTKRHEAQERQKTFDAMTLIQKLEKLDRVPGAAKKERAKLLKKIQAEQVKK